MSSGTYDVVVVGGGIFGAPAARALAERGLSVAVVVSPEPEDPRTHTGPFGAHYDVSRLTWRTHADPTHMAMSDHALAAFQSMHERHGGIILSHGSLFLTAPGRDEGRLATAESEGFDILSADAVMEQFPFLAVPEDVVGFFEADLPSIIDPRVVIAAELATAESLGAHVIRTHATEVRDDGMVRLANGDGLMGGSVLVAAGGFSNLPGLLPTPLALRLKRESVLLAHLDGAATERLAEYPALVYQIAAREISDIYSSPPLPYPDGSVALKWGANTLADEWLADHDAVLEWYRGGDSDPAGTLIRPHMEATLPTMNATSWSTHRCAITYTSHGKPYMDRIGERLFVSVGGNGHSAKWAPTLGDMAAGLVAEGAWDLAVPADEFQAVLQGEETSWHHRDLWADRVS